MFETSGLTRSGSTSSFYNSNIFMKKKTKFLILHSSVIISFHAILSWHLMDHQPRDDDDDDDEGSELLMIELNFSK